MLFRSLPEVGQAGFDLNFAFVGGDEYCAGGLTPLDGTNTDKVYKVNNVVAPGSCGIAACPPGF